MEKKYSSSKSGQVSSTPSTPTKRKQRADESEDHPKIHIKSASLKKNKDISPEHEMNPGWCSNESFGVRLECNDPRLYCGVNGFSIDWSKWIKNQ